MKLRLLHILVLVLVLGIILEESEARWTRRYGYGLRRRFLRHYKRYHYRTRIWRRRHGYYGRSEDDDLDINQLARALDADKSELEEVLNEADLNGDAEEYRRTETDLDEDDNDNSDEDIDERYLEQLLASVTKDD